MTTSGMWVELRGDLFSTFEADAVVITTNGYVDKAGKCVMGKGTAEQARDRFPGIDKRLGGLVTQYGNRVFRVQKVSLFGRDDVWIVSFPVKPVEGPNGEPGWRCRADIEIIRTSCKQLVEVTDKFGFKTVVLPRPGCGNGQLKWERVLASGALDPIREDLRFVVVERNAE